MNSMETREWNYKNKKVYKPNNFTYQRSQGFYSGNRGNNFINNYSNNGTSTNLSRNAFHSRHTRYYQHNRREPFQSYKEYHWQPSRKVRREPSPLNGSEEYTLRKIQETSDMIKRQLMSPEYTSTNDNFTNNKVSEPINNKSTKVKIKFNKNKITKEASLLKRKLQRKAALRAKLYKSLAVEKSSDVTYNVKEIHDQIMNHISKLNYGRKQNLINADTTCYDAALQQMYKQKSLELSKALREMSHQEKPEASEVVNSIIPDFAIKFEELPIHVIRELSSTFEALEKNIGNDDNISPFDFFTYSAEDQGLHNTAPINDGFHEYLPKKDTFQSDGNSNVNYVQGDIDDRVLILNSEDSDNMVIKEENVDEILIKLETSDLEIEDDVNNEINVAHSLSTQASSIIQHADLIEEPNQDNTNIVQIHSDNRLETSPEFKTTMYSETSAIIGTVRVNQSIFENTNEQITNENQNENLLLESQNHFTTNCNSNGLIPSLRVSTNLFNKRENHLSPMHSATHNYTSVEGIFDTSSTFLEDNESSQQQIIEMINVKEPNNSEVTIGSKNIALENKSDPFINVSKISDIISTRLSQIEKSSNNLDLSCTSSQVGVPLLKNTGNSRAQWKKQNGNSTFSPKSSETQFSFDNCNTTCHSRDTSLMLNTQNSKENQKHKSVFQAEMETDNYFSVSIKKFQKPRDFAQAVQIMFEIDNEIEKLTKLRQSLLSNIIDQKLKDSKSDSPNSCITNKKKKKNNSKAKKRKLNSQRNHNESTCSSIQIEKSDSGDNNNQERIQNEDTMTNCVDKQLKKKCDSQQKNNSPTFNNESHVQDIRNRIDLDVNNLTGVPIICKALRQESSLIIGTDNGKILYFDLHSSEKPFTVGISKHAISCLDYAYVGAELLIFTGTAVENTLRIFRYKKGGNSKTVRLEDTIQAMQKEWSYFFIGGNRGFLTRYNYQRDKIEFEDRISEMDLLDLRATREGPRKILIILFKDIFGYKHIHVRDAMSALHMRTIGEQMNTHINSLLVKDSSLFVSSNNEIFMYNYCDGQFITKLTMPSMEFITFLHKNGNLLFATTSDGFIYTYNFKSMNSVGYIRCDPISMLVVIQDKVIYGSWSKTMKSLTIPEHILAVR